LANNITIWLAPPNPLKAYPGRAGYFSKNSILFGKTSEGTEATIEVNKSYGKFIYEALNNIFANSDYNDSRIKEFFFAEVYQMGDNEFVEFIENAINEELTPQQQNWVKTTLKEISSDLKADDFDSTGLDEIKINKPIINRNIIDWARKFYKFDDDNVYKKIWGNNQSWEKFEKEITQTTDKTKLAKILNDYFYNMSDDLNKLLNPSTDINEYTIDDEEVEEFLEELKKCSIDLKEGVLEEAEYQGRKVTLNKPMRGDVKKSKVYVKNEKGNVVKVNFGQKGMSIKKNNPERRKAFRARHNCENPGPKWKARFWSCKAW
jgi:hypothetical protein